MVSRFCIVYLGSRDNDSPLDIKVVDGGSLDTAIRSARTRVEHLAFAGTAPSGFAIENTEGDELFRWYR